MKPDVTLRQATAEIKTIASQLERQYPNTNSGVGASGSEADGFERFLLQG